MNAIFTFLKSLSLRQVVSWLAKIAAGIFWHLPTVMLFRLPIRFARFMLNPANRFKAFIIMTLFALVLTARTLVRKAVERRSRLQNRNVFQQFQISARCENDDLCVCSKCTEKMTYSRRKAAKDFLKRSWQKIRQTSVNFGRRKQGGALDNQDK